jgi:hypothetical protein
MYIEIEDLKKHVSNTVSMEEYVKSLKKDEPTVILRNYNEPTTPPCLENGAKGCRNCRYTIYIYMVGWISDSASTIVGYYGGCAVAYPPYR